MILFKRPLTTPLILLTALFLSACQEHAHHKESSVFNTANPWRQDVNVKQEYVAQIKAIQHIEIRAFEKGYLQSTFVDEGQNVTKDQKMFQIMPLLVNAEYDKAKAEFDVSEIEYTNTKKLAKQNVVSANELALKKARYNKAKAVMDLAKAHKDFTTISAPFDGRMDKLRVRLGSLVEEGELLTSLADTSSLWVYFNVTERDYLNYMQKKKETDEGAVVQLKLANGQLFDYTGKIDAIEADFDAETGNVPFRATFPNPDGLLRHGETGNVVLEETLKGALVIPQKATFEVLDKRYVFVVDNRGVVQQREIAVEKEVPHFFVISSGLSESDAVLMEGLGKVNKGQTIKTKLQLRPDVMKSLELAAN